MMDNIVVSICCITYNHSSYIRQCLDGFLLQQTNFEYEILIHDDASTDGTVEIIREYESRYPKLIKPIYEEENQWVKGRRGSAVFNFPRARGKYIAMCEGDDYWTDPLKLQRQVDYLNEHTDYVICSHAYNILDENILSPIQSSESDLDYDINNLIVGDWYYQTMSLLFRRDAYYDSNIDYQYASDVMILYRLLSSGGKGRYISSVMGCYRHHDKGVWSKASINTQREGEFVRRLSIAEVDKSRRSMIFLISLFRKPISRLWIMHNKTLMCDVIKIVYAHCGYRFTVKFILKRFIFNQILTRNELWYLLGQ